MSDRFGWGPGEIGPDISRFEWKPDEVEVVDTFIPEVPEDEADTTMTDQEDPFIPLEGTEILIPETIEELRYRILRGGSDGSS